MALSSLTAPAPCDNCNRDCDGEAVSSGMSASGESTQCVECTREGTMVQCALGCGLWCDAALGDLCNRHHWIVVELSMLPRDVAERFIGIQTGDGSCFALWNAPGGTTRAVAIGPQPTWVYESEAA